MLSLTTVRESVRYENVQAELRNLLQANKTSRKHTMWNCKKKKKKNRVTIKNMNLNSETGLKAFYGGNGGFLYGNPSERNVAKKC